MLSQENRWSLKWNGDIDDNNYVDAARWGVNGISQWKERDKLHTQQFRVPF